MTKVNTDPQQIVCTGEAGSDKWNCAFGTWSADDFGIDSDEPVGTGERLYVRRELFDAACKVADGHKEALHALTDKSDGQAKRIAELEAAMREFIAAAEKAKKAYTVPESVLVAMGYPKGEATS